MQALFRDRHQAGRLLATRLWGLAHHGDVRVVALPRGGVPVACEVAAALGAPMSVFPVRRVAVPDAPAAALGAVAPGGVSVVNDEVARAHGVPREAAARAAAREAEGLARSATRYGDDAAVPDVERKTAILVDDGLVTGTTARLAIAALRALGAARVIVAAPVASRESRNALSRLVDGWVVVAEPEPFGVVGNWYEHFPQLTDDDVAELLAAARTPPQAVEPTS